MDGMKYFEEMASELYNPEVRAWKQAGKRVIGTLCSNIPEEVIHAAGLLPIRLRTPGLQDTSKADSHLHRINCSYSRSILEFLLRGELEFFDGLVATNTCDHHMRVAGELEDKSNFPFFYYFQMYHSFGEGSKEWLLLEMKKMLRQIEESFAIKVSEEDLQRTISVYNRTRRLMARVNELRKSDPPSLSGGEYMQIVLTGMSIPREQFNEKLEILLPELDGRVSGKAGLPRLLIIGGACDSPEFIDFIESKGASVVADGLCFGLRHYQGIIDEHAADPLQAIADRYFSRVSCPSVIDGFDQGYAILREIISELGVQGVVSARLKFCDHWSAARMLLKDAMQKDSGVPLLDIEREYFTTGSGQISTRVQAFLEMLKS